MATRVEIEQPVRQVAARIQPGLLDLEVIESAKPYEVAIEPYLKGDKGDPGDPGAAGPTGPVGPGLPTGGTQGQIARKKSNTNYDTAWGRDAVVYAEDFIAAAPNALTGLNTAIAFAATSGIKRVLISGPDITLTSPVIITQAGITIECDVTTSTTLIQNTWGEPVFLVVADDATFKNVRCVANQTVRNRITAWAGTNYATTYNQRNVQRDYCAGIVSLNCHRTAVLDSYFEKFFCGVTFFGFYNGGTNVTRGRDHRMQRCRTQNCDMGVLAYLTDGAIVTDNKWYDIDWTQPTAPPHGCYFSVERQTDGDYTPGDDHYRLTYANNICINNPFSSGHKFKACRESTVYNNTADSCVRGYDIDYCFGSQFSELRTTNVVDYVWPTAATHPQYGATATADNQYRYNGGVITDSQTSGINVVDCSDLQFESCSVEKASTDSCDGLLLRSGDNGGTNRVQVNNLRVSSNNTEGLSGSLLNNAAYVANCTNFARITILSWDNGNNALVTNWLDFGVMLADGSPVTVRTPLSGATPPGGLTTGVTYYTKESAANPAAVELYTDAGLTSRVTITSAPVGTVFLATQKPVIDTANDIINVNWDPVSTSSVPDGSPVILTQPIISSTMPGGLATNTVYYTKQSALCTGWVELHSNVSLTSKVDITSIGSGQLRLDTALQLSGSTVDVANDKFIFPTGVVVANLWANGNGIRVFPQQDGSSTIPGGLSQSTVYYAKTGAAANELELYTTDALTTKVDITSVGSGVLRFHRCKAPSGAAVFFSACTDVKVVGCDFQQLGTNSNATGARPFRIGSGAVRCALEDYRIFGTDRHGQIDAGATNCFINVAHGSNNQWYSASWSDNGSVGLRVKVSPQNIPVSFSSNQAQPTLGMLASVFQTNANTATWISNFQGIKWDGRVVKILAGENGNTRIATGSIGVSGLSSRVSAANDDVDLQQPALELFQSGTPVTLTTSSSLPGGLDTSTTYYVKVGSRGPNYLQFCTDTALTSVVNITSTGGGTMTIKSPATDNFILAEGINYWISQRNPSTFIEFTWKANENKWVQTGGSSYPRRVWYTTGTAGAPSSSLGNIGSLALDSGGDVYEKVDATTWVLRQNIRGATGPTGPQGPAGASGTPSVAIDASTYTISNSNTETLVGTVALAGGQVTQNGQWFDFEHNAVYLNNTGGTQTINFRLQNGSTTLYQSGTSTTISASANNRTVRIFGRIRRTGNTTGYLTLSAIVGAAGNPTTGTGTFSGAAFVSTVENNNLTSTPA